MVAITTFVNIPSYYDHEGGAKAQHLTRRGKRWKALRPAVNHAFLKFKELTSPTEYVAL